MRLPAATPFEAWEVGSKGKEDEPTAASHLNAGPFSARRGETGPGQSFAESLVSESALN